MNDASRPDVADLTRKASTVAGTRLAGVAWQSRSPSEAAEVAAFLGHAKEVVQATRWAAVVAREERAGKLPPGTFWTILGPPQDGDGRVDMPRRSACPIRLDVFCRASTRWSPLNAAELDVVEQVVRDALRPYGVRVCRSGRRRRCEPEPRSRLDEPKPRGT